MSRRQKLLKDLILAFPADPVPSVVVKADHGEAGFCHELIAGRRWTSLSTEEVIQGEACLSFLGGGLLAYYMPAYMSAALALLEEDAPRWSDLLQQIEAFLLYTGEDSPLFNSYDPVQRKVVIDFLVRNREFALAMDSWQNMDEDAFQAGIRFWRSSDEFET